MSTDKSREFNTYYKKGSKWYQRTDEDSSLNNTLEIDKTTITTTATRVTTSDNSTSFIMTNKTNNIAYIGNEEVTVDTGFPLEYLDSLEFSDYYSGDGNEIFAITAAGTSVIYVMAGIKE